MNNFWLRPVAVDDLEQVYNLVRQQSGGMISLPQERDLLLSDLQVSAELFNQDFTSPKNGKYILVLELLASKQIIGICAISTVINSTNNLVVYSIQDKQQQWQQLQYHTRYLVPNYPWQSYSELCSLFIDREFRAYGFGWFLSRIRLVLMKLFPQLFFDPIIAEMRGVILPNGSSPFWSLVYEDQININFQELTAYRAKYGRAFDNAIMLQYPINLQHLDPSVQNTMMVPCPAAMPAYLLLLQNGFLLSDYMDVFDMGPLLVAKQADLYTWQHSKLLTVVKIVDQIIASKLIIIANTMQQKFRACVAKVRVIDDQIIIDIHTAELLSLAIGDQVIAEVENGK